MKRAYLTGLVCITIAGAVTACGQSNADKADENLKKEAEKFNVLRSVTVTSGINGEVMYYVEGRCSFEQRPGGIDVLCKELPGDTAKSFRKATILKGDQDIVVITQLREIKVSEYRTKIIFRPKALIPDLDLVTEGS